MPSELDHIAILTSSVQRVGATAPAWLSLGAIEEFPSEGTAERYLAPASGTGPSILLIEPIDSGPYRRALTTRGPGLHHLAWAVGDVRATVDRWRSDGWRLHDISMSTLDDGTAWMYRTGFPALAELFETSGSATHSDTNVLVSVPARVGATVSPHEVEGVTIDAGAAESLHIRIGSEHWDITA